ncbi:MAG: hypothetical protein L0Y72_31370 [Gemmataceae bacterium]|nr:hypothetical protein [Gemmataceae bacterium]MCI0743552.1 hypothetical protein [Gemmataceae bacterium]
MIGITLLLCGPLYHFGPETREARVFFGLVKKLDSVSTDKRMRLQQELSNEPIAIWAVFWGSRQENLEIAVPCLDILEKWKWQARLSKMVYDADGDFDRFVNTYFCAMARDPSLLERASEEARALDRYYVKKSFLAHPKGIASLATSENAVATPFHDFLAYVQRRQPVSFHGGVLRSPPIAENKCYLALCDGVQCRQITYSMILSEGNVNVDEAFRTVILSGADVRIASASSSLIIASGDVKLERNAGHLFVIAGGTVTVPRDASATLCISARKIQVAGRPKLSIALFLDGKPKPAPELFAFRDLWPDFGLEAVLHEGRVKITKVKPGNQIAELFKENDVILSRAKKTVESVGQFRRLLGHSRDTGRLDFQVEREGQQMAIQANWKSVNIRQ